MKPGAHRSMPLPAAACGGVVALPRSHAAQNQGAICDERARLLLALLAYAMG